jgi:hypothetical protein
MATIYANSILIYDVNTAIEEAVSGDTIIVPSGSASWSSPITIPNTKNITMQGAGIGLSNLTGNGFNLGTSSSRITGFSFSEARVFARGYGWRVDHCSFVSVGGMEAVSAYSLIEGHNPDGLVDNCTLHNSRVLVYGATGMLSEGPYQHQLWAQDLDLGTEKAVYIEDCTFTDTISPGQACDAQFAGKYVIRYCTLNDVYIECHSVQDNNRAGRSWEIYHNTFNGTNVQFCAVFLRGGTGCVYDNVIAGTWPADPIHLDNVRSFTSMAFPPGRCDGSSAWDENTTGMSGWRGRDQIGIGGDNSLWTAQNPYPSQSHVPAYFWNNTIGGVEVQPIVTNGCEAWIQADRDYYVGTAMPGYHAYTYPHPLRGQAPESIMTKQSIRMRF